MNVISTPLGLKPGHIRTPICLRGSGNIRRVFGRHPDGVIDVVDRGPQSSRPSARRLVTNGRYHFLCLRMQRFAQLTLQDNYHYTDTSNNVVAERRQPTGSIEQETHVTLRPDTLFSYREDNRLVPLLVTDSYRFSERELEEFRLLPDRTDFQGESFCYFQQFGLVKQHQRQRMHVALR
jgi:hypothetical protein